MLYDVGKILRDTRIVLDRNGDDRDLLPVDTNTQLLDEAIVHEVEDSVRQVVNGAPVELLDSTHNIMGDESGGPSIRWLEKGGSTVAGAIVLPADFLRLVAFKMSDWERTAYDIVTEGSKEYDMQSSRFAGVRGTPQKPVVAIVRSQYGQELEFYSCRSEDAEIEKAVYLPYPRIEGGAIEIPERCYWAVVMTIAAMTMSNVGESDRASAYFEMAKNVLI